MVAHALNPSAREAEADDLHGVSGQPDIDSEIIQGLLSAHDGLELAPS